MNSEDLMRKSERLAKLFENCAQTKPDEESFEDCNEMATLSAEQFERLMEKVATCHVRPGSFSNCVHRFNGDRDPSRVEEFIAARRLYRRLLIRTLLMVCPCF